MEYLRPVPHLKPLGSAITSVFVSTFATLPAMWIIFSLVAGALARPRTTGDIKKETNFTSTNLSTFTGYGYGKSNKADWDNATEVTHLSGQKELNMGLHTPLACALM
ncbi:hypothetical protein DFH08DRAFT_1082928 [Mycena albidolilacea]|uniref:Uncharacterized protein n=1 Tax=Mycena albidolilacea TaxID=1033008 RepID=A0AAD6ZSK9_9AGAR|nr:hypothetical protein DFH08DRAFT_1082928 [Mycena albidolilacea]